MNRKTVGIYIHIPFCVQKCLYCDFISGPASQQIKKEYIEQLLKEIELRTTGDGSFTVDTIFIGGGTPSVLEAKDINRILCKLREGFDILPDCECSMEVNPGTVDKNRLKEYREAGINRLSIGLQSCNDNELKVLGRIHDFKAFEETFRLAREAGFDNINVDLMSSIPEQTVESFRKSLKCVAGFEPEHISVYSLIVEEGTPFYNMDLNLPSEDDERLIYHETGRMLEEYGYKQYEISNYAKSGRECKHNIRYWKCDEYIGFGVAAASYLNGVRWKNTEDINCYIKYLQESLAETDLQSENFCCEREILTIKDQYAEFMFMGLRMNEGISEKEFANRFGVSVNEIYGDIISKHIQNSLLVRTDERIQLTDRGRDISNCVMADFIFLE